MKKGITITSKNIREVLDKAVSILSRYDLMSRYTDDVALRCWYKELDNLQKLYMSSYLKENRRESGQREEKEKREKKKTL